MSGNSKGGSTSQLSRFKNAFGATPGKTIYTNVKTDSSAPTKLKANADFCAVPTGNNGNIGIFPLPLATSDTTIKVEHKMPLVLAHNKQIQDFEFSPLEPSILASSTRHDNLIRIWKLPSEELLQTYPPAMTGNEVEAANMYLAGHEKKIELIKFHPTLGNIMATASADTTVRLWEIESLQDRIVLNSGNDSPAQSLTFDYCGDKLVTATTDGHLHLYDPRAFKAPVESIQSGHIAAKSCRVCWLTPENLFVSTGFKDKGEREVRVWDTRFLRKDSAEGEAGNFGLPLAAITASGTGTALLNPHWDPALPLLYCTSKGEGIRLYELVEGDLKYINMLKVDKQATAFDLLPKTVCVTSKCEIARFLRLGTDYSIESTSVYIPRVNGEAEFQEDLYPAVAYVDPDVNASQWFDDYESIEPMMVDLFKEPGNVVSKPSEKASEKLSLEEEKLKRRISVTPSELTVKRTNTSRRRTISSQNAPDLKSTSGDGGSSDSEKKLDKVHPNLALYREGFVEVERKGGWFGSVWERRYLSLKKTKLYVSVDAESDLTSESYQLANVTKLQGTTIGPANPPKNTPNINYSNQIGITMVQNDGATIKFKTSSQAERDAWLEALKSARELAGGGSKYNIGPAEGGAEPKKEEKTTSKKKGADSNTRILVGNREGAALIGQLQLLASDQPPANAKGSTAAGNTVINPNALPWSNQFVVLDDDGLLHLYPPDIKEYVQGKPPLETLMLSTAISVRLTDITGGGHADITESLGSPGGIALTIFQINTPKRSVFFRVRKAHEAANWVLEIRRVIMSKCILPAATMVSNDCVEGYVELSPVVVPPAPVGGGTIPSVMSRVPAIPSIPPPRDEAYLAAIMGPLASGGRFWLSVIDGTFYYYRTHLSKYPIHVVPAVQFENVFEGPKISPAETAAAKPAAAKGTTAHTTTDVPFEYTFEIGYIEGAKSRHAVKVESERDSWIRELTKLRMENFDILGKVGITSDQSLKEELSKTRADVVWEDSKGKRASVASSADVVGTVQYVDEKLLDKGEQKLLICVKGKLRITISKVELSWKHIRHDCVYVLDAGNNVYHWNGKTSSRVARAKGMDVATRIRKNRSNRPRVLLVEDDEHERLQVFFNALGLPDPSVSGIRSFLGKLPTAEMEESGHEYQVRVFKVVDSLIRRKRLALIYEGNGPSKELLDSNCVYVVQSPTEVFQWVGKSATSEHKLLANLVTRRLAIMLRDAVRVSVIHIQRVYEEQESAVFREKFIDYEGSLPISMRIEEKKGNVVTGLKQTPIDITKLLAYVPTTPITDMDKEDPSLNGRISMFLVRDFEKEEVPSSLAGQFFRNESYIVMYIYRPPSSGVDKCVSYFWQGSHSTVTQKGTSALITIELSKETGGDVTQVRVPEGKEPRHLISIFKTAPLIVCVGSPSRVSPSDEKPVAIDIREHCDGVCKTFECDLSELPFHESSVHLIATESTVYQWNGRFSLPSEIAHASRVTSHLFRERESVLVRSANPVFDLKDLTDDLQDILKPFWHNRGVANERVFPSDKRIVPKLFSCSSGSGIVAVEPVNGFTQEDLDPNTVLILDVFNQIFVWFGLTSKANEKIIGMETAVSYLEQSTIHNKDQTLLTVTYAYQEPRSFTTHFHGWTSSRFPKDKQNVAPRVRPLAEVLKEYKQETYSLDILMGSDLPEHVDQTKLEMYLTEDDFESLFKMRKEEYLQMQPWKREKLKKDIGLF
ncbi:hypothetical protein BJ742DRAFT_829278 [Cladochytrium replicatum]|nr:hypothetical protein BJ742DRAFT_829278 [Cladochytrium replicatum]